MAWTLTPKGWALWLATGKYGMVSVPCLKEAESSGMR